MTIEEIKGKAILILERYGVKKAAIFGSLVQGESKSGSDVDILVENVEP
jgi:predicted nucleotidyltransferase